MSTGFLVSLLGLLVVLGICSALFSAIETSFFSLQPYHIERLKTRRAAFAATLARLMENPRRLLAAILLADSLVNLPFILLCLFFLRTEYMATLPFWLTALVVFAAVVFLGDLVPKVAALAEPYRVVKIGVRVMSVVLPVVDPLARVLQQFSEWVARTFLPERSSPNASLTEDELATLVELGEEAGTLHAAEGEMIQEIMKLGDKTVRDCMTPRVDAFVVPYDLTNEELIPRLRSRRHRHVPVYGETPDEILGILNVRAFLTAMPDHYTELVLPPSFVPETMMALDLMRNFLQHPQPMAIVVDEHGGTEGIITLADIVEEIISDAVPQAERELYIEKAGENRLIVAGGARLEDINELLHTELHEEGIETIGGLVFNRLGTLPKPGTEVKIDGLSVTVRRTSRKRLEELMLFAGPARAQDAEEGAAP